MLMIVRTTVEGWKDEEEECYLCCVWWSVGFEADEKSLSFEHRI